MLELKNISIHFKQFSLSEINLEVKEKDYFVLLGSSGSGKTVLLEIIAGLITPNSGSIFLKGENITYKKIQHRKIGIVFQDYALFPHFTVFENIAFPLKQYGVPKDEVSIIVHSLAKKLDIELLLSRKPQGLSGGEKQRVALARTLAMKPDVLLLDEPLSALDTRLRWETRMLLRKLNKEGQTIIHVTHDYEEALVLANKVAIINHGIIEQTGTPIEIFQHPKSPFIASLTGIKNYFLAEIISCSEEQKMSNAILEKGMQIMVAGILPKGKGYIMMNSHNIVLSIQKPINETVNVFSGIVNDIFSSRNGLEVLVDTGIPLFALVTDEFISQQPLQIGQKIWVRLGEPIFIQK